MAVVTKVVNQVQYKAAGSDWKSGKKGVTLTSEDEIKTGSKSLALIKFTDNSLLRVRENSLVKLYAKQEGDKVAKNTMVDQGKVSFDVKDQEDKDFKFTTPTMVASIRGTTGIVAILVNGSTLFALEDGLADLTALLGSKQTGSLGSNQYAIIDTEGNITVYEFDDLIEEEINSAKNTETSRIIIKTSEGDLIIEYFDEE